MGQASGGTYVRSGTCQAGIQLSQRVRAWGERAEEGLRHVYEGREAESTILSAKNKVERGVKEDGGPKRSDEGAGV
jgi:hypothetical protein